MRNGALQSQGGKLFFSALLSLLLMVAMTGCGGGGGGGSSSSSTSSKLLANFHFYYTIISQYDDRIVINDTGTSTNSDGEPIYRGHKDGNTSYPAVASYYPSSGKNLMLLATGIADTYWAYRFVIESDDRLTGSWYMYSDGQIVGNGYDFDSGKSRRYELGSSWRDIGDSAHGSVSAQFLEFSQVTTYRSTGIDAEAVAEIEEMAAQLR